MKKRTKNGAPLEFVKWASQQETDDCIEWPYSRSEGGYGRLRLKGKVVKAHRLSLAMRDCIEAPANLHCLHQSEVCHNPLCINPRHLRWGDHSENMKDRAKDGTNPLGERTAFSKLTEKQVKVIKGLRGVRQKCLASVYGVDRSSISLIHSGKNWGWI